MATVPQASQWSSVEAAQCSLRLRWPDVKQVAHTKHHIVLYYEDSGCGGGAHQAAKLKLCVGSSRCKESFEMLVGHQKMSAELSAKWSLAKEAPAKYSAARIAITAPRAPAHVTPPTSVKVLPVSEDSGAAATPPTRKNTVRIYVPFSETPAECDVTTRVIPIATPPPVAAAERDGAGDFANDSTDVPSGSGSPRKGTLVRMGTRVSSDALIREKQRLAGVATPPSGAYVIGASRSSLNR